MAVIIGSAWGKMSEYYIWCNLVKLHRGRLYGTEVWLYLHIFQNQKSHKKADFFSSTCVYICNLSISGSGYSSGTRLEFTQTAAVVKTNTSRQRRCGPSQRRPGLDVIVFKRNPLGRRQRGLTPGHGGFINLLLPLEVPGRAGWRAYKRIEPVRM